MFGVRLLPRRYTGLLRRASHLWPQPQLPPPHPLYRSGRCRLTGKPASGMTARTPSTLRCASSPSWPKLASSLSRRRPDFSISFLPAHLKKTGTLTPVRWAAACARCAISLLCLWLSPRDLDKRIVSTGEDSLTFAYTDSKTGVEKLMSLKPFEVHSAFPSPSFQAAKDVDAAVDRTHAQPKTGAAFCPCCSASGHVLFFSPAGAI